MEELISVIVPVYNVENYLEHCIESIVFQTYKNLEIILVDDGSIDRSGFICDCWKNKDSRIKVIHKKNGGLASARNEGIKISKGKYISFIDSDDYIELNFYKTMIDGIDDADIAICGLRLVNEKNQLIKTIELNKEKIEMKNLDIKKLLLLINNSTFGYAWNKLYKKDIIIHNEFENLMPREDLMFNLSILKNINKISIVGSYSGYNWLQRKKSITHTKNLRNVATAITISDKLIENLNFFSKKNSKILYNCIMKILLVDVVLSDIIKNNDINELEKKQFINILLSNNNIRKNLTFSSKDNRYTKIMLICIKLRVPYLLLRISKC